MLNRIGFVFMVFLLSFSLIACGGGEKSAASNTNENNDTKSNNESKELFVMDWGGALTEAHKKAMFEPFEKEYGVKITAITPTDYGKLTAMIKSGNVVVDVANVGHDYVYRGEKEGLLEKLDYSIINKEGVSKDLVTDYGIATELTSYAISYNSEKFPKGSHPKNWSEFWDTTKFPGPRTFWKNPVSTLEAALLADGVKPEELYPIDVDRAFKSLDKIKKNIKVWWDAGAQPAQLLANGEVVLAAAWNGRITNAKKEGAPEEVEYNQGIILADSWVIPKGALHKDLAMKFIAFALDPKQQAAFSTYIDYAPANSKALDLLPKEAIEQLGQSAENAKNQIIVNDKWWLENYDAVNKRFEQWLLE